MSDIRVPAVRLRRPSWRDPRFLAGMLLVLISVAAGARIVALADNTVAVYVTKHSLASGSALTPEVVAVTRVRLGDQTTPYLAAGGSLASGLVVLRPLGAGELIPRAALGSTAELARRPVSIPVPAPFPQGLRPGATVDLWASAKLTGTAATGFGPPARIAQGAEVFAVSAPSGSLSATGSGAVQILLDEPGVQAALDALANDATLAVVPVPSASGERPQ